MLVCWFCHEAAQIKVHRVVSLDQSGYTNRVLKCGCGQNQSVVGKTHMSTLFLYLQVHVIKLQILVKNIIITLFQEDNIFGTNARLTYGLQLLRKKNI